MKSQHQRWLIVIISYVSVGTSGSCLNSSVVLLPLLLNVFFMVRSGKFPF